MTKPESKTPRTDAFGQQAMDDVLADLGGEVGEAISELCAGWSDLCEKLERELSDHLAKVAELEAVIAAKTAEIDRLMLEFCPDEMTPEQVEEWGKRQRPCSPELQAAVDAALKGSGDV